jgi:PAS domain S-box-containing protein
VTKSWAMYVVGLLAGAAIFGVSAVYGSPEGGHAIGIWPVALASAPLLVARRPPTSVVLALVFLIAVLTIWTGRPFDVSVGLAGAITLETWVFWRIFTNGVRTRPTLYTDRELARFIAAAAAGALVVAGGAALTSEVTGWGTPGLLALALAASGLASQLSVTPFFARLRGHGGMAPLAERIAQWVLILTVTPIVFALDDFPAIVFLVIPLLGWAALRDGAYEALAQLFAVLGIAIALTTRGHGPFAVVDRYGLDPDVQGILLCTFIVACALIVIPLILSVGEQLENARQVAGERDRVQNIVHGASGVAIIGTDENALVTLFNPGAERLLGYTAEEMTGQTTRSLHSDEAIAEKAAELGVANDFGAVARALVAMAGPTDMRFLRKDGEERSHSMSLNRIEDDRGKLLGYVSTSEDITERLRAQQAALEALESERRAVERLREVDQVKDAFVSSVSHELRTPITSILGYTEMLEDGVYGDLREEQLDAVRRVGSNSARLLSLIDDLLTLSRVQEDGIAFVDRLVDLRKIVAAGCAVVAPTLQRRQLAMTIDLPDDPIPFLGDRDMLERVVINLVGNAVKFTPEGGRIDVGLVTEGDSALLSVADTGIGIPLEEQEKLFTRFFRSSLAQEQAIPGSGLGLSIARAIVEKHGGSMSVESEPSEGTTFRVRLPVLAPG